MKKSALFLLLLLFTSASLCAQTLAATNEVSIFSFKTKKGKIATLSKDRNNGYIVYRYGTKDNIELEYPAKAAQNPESWKKFKYNGYSRGGGKQNAGMEIDNVMFENQNFQYILFTSYHAEDDAFRAGLHVIDLKTHKQTRIIGIRETQQGELYDFKNNKLLETDDFGLFD